MSTRGLWGDLADKRIEESDGEQWESEAKQSLRDWGSLGK